MPTIRHDADVDDVDEIRLHTAARCAGSNEKTSQFLKPMRMRMRLGHIDRYSADKISLEKGTAISGRLVSTDDISGTQVDRRRAVGAANQRRCGKDGLPATNTIATIAVVLTSFELRVAD